MTTRYDVYRFINNGDGEPMASDALMSMGLEMGEYTCPYISLLKTGPQSTPYSTANIGSRVVNITTSNAKIIRFSIDPESLFPNNDSDTSELLYPIVSEPGVFGSRKKVKIATGNPEFPMGFRTVIMVPSTMGLSVNQAWAISRTYLADPFNPGNK